MLLQDMTGSGMLPSKDRLLIIANRLPITVKQNEDCEYVFTPSSGGLVTGLNGITESSDCQWFGWPGIDVPRRHVKGIQKQLAEEFSAVPIWLSQKICEHHYNGFSNSILWPALHEFQDLIRPDHTAGIAYEAVNRLFAKEISSHVRNDDVIWIHDYHLMLLPQYLREELGDSVRGVKIGFFLHTPFPGSDVWKDVPMSADLLKGLLGSDLIGFHTEQYVKNFEECCRDLLFLDTDERGIHIQTTVETRTVQAIASPIGISPADFTHNLSKPALQFETQLQQLKDDFKPYRLLLGVDRIDYTKGLPEKLRAFSHFLETRPEYAGRVVLLQIGVPSRESLSETKRVLHEIYSLVGEINSKHGSINYTPVRFLHQSISKPLLAALYAVSDVCLVTAIRDGMNLVSYEYVACQQERNGVLLLGKRIGAATTLKGAVLIDPRDCEDVAGSIAMALEMQAEERRRRQEVNMRTVTTQTSAAWGRDFVQRLREV